MNTVIKMAPYDKRYVVPASQEDYERLSKVPLWGVPDIVSSEIEYGYDFEGVYGGLYERAVLAGTPFRRSMAIEGLDVVILPESLEDESVSDADRVKDALRTYVAAYVLLEMAHAQFEEACEGASDDSVPQFPVLVDGYIVRDSDFDDNRYVIEKVSTL